MNDADDMQRFQKYKKEYPWMEMTSTRTILKVSNPDYWYKELVGTEVTIHNYGTFGCWDSQGRWYNFYDLSEIV